MLEKISLDILKEIDTDSYVISDPHFFHKRIFEFEKSRLIEVLKHSDISEQFVKIIMNYISDDSEENTKELQNIAEELVIYHNEILIKNWNETISNADIVICIGDFAWKGIQEIIPLLNGRKILILGNHDKTGENSYPDFTVVRGLIEILSLKKRKIIMKEYNDINLKIDKHFSALIINNSIFSHYPISEYEKSFSRRGENSSINTRIDKLMDIAIEYDNIEFNFHGHTHSRNINPVKEKQGLLYYNVSCEQIDFKPRKIKDIMLDEIDQNFFNGVM